MKSEGTNQLFPSINIIYEDVRRELNASILEKELEELEESMT